MWEETQKIKIERTAPKGLSHLELVANVSTSLRIPNWITLKRTGPASEALSKLGPVFLPFSPWRRAI